MRSAKSGFEYCSRLLHEIHSSPYARGCFSPEDKGVSRYIFFPVHTGGVSRPEKPGGVSEFGVVALAEVVFEYAPQTVEQTDMGKFGNDKVVN